MNHSAMIETGRQQPRNSVLHLVSPLDNFVSGCNMHSKDRHHRCYDYAEVSDESVQITTSGRLDGVGYRKCGRGTAFKTQAGSPEDRQCCARVHGGHELYRARTETKLYQECLLCGYETPGWTIDRRDRRLHLVSNPHSRVAARR
jgi:hypothetical protein